MPVSFPTNPTVGQTYTFGGVTWQWNGTTWVNAASGTAFVPVAGGVTVTGTLPHQGVTDGSSPAAGQVGEYTANLQSGTQAQFTLSPGDYDVSGWVQGSPTVAGGGQLTIRITVGGTVLNGTQIAMGQGVQNAAVTLTMPPVRVSLTAPTLVLMDSSQSVNIALGQSFISARRVR